MSTKLFFIALFLTLVHSQVLDKTTFSYDNFSSIPHRLTYQGVANVPSGFTFLRLSKLDTWGRPEEGGIGRVLYSRPVRMWRNIPARHANFETTIRFVITPTSTGSADSIVFFVAPVNTAFDEGSSGSNLGIFNPSTGTTPSLFAVEFDTFSNPPYDPNYNHIGINIESRASRVTAQFDSGRRELVTARIKYDADKNTVNVTASTATQAASLSYVYDLTTLLPQQVQVGISSSGYGTAVRGVQDLISWNFNSSLVRYNVNAPQYI